MEPARPRKTVGLAHKTAPVPQDKPAKATNVARPILVEMASVMLRVEKTAEVADETASVQRARCAKTTLV